MGRTAEAISFGAVTVVNAMATGKGAALGVGLWTRAKVTITNLPNRFVCHNLSDPREDSTLMKTVAKRVLLRFRKVKTHGALIQTTSNIPIAVGLKSSSAASNAIALATTAALGHVLSDLDLIKLAVDGSLDAGVTLTGAFDDACACYFGGIIVTDNNRRRILRKFRPKRGFRVLVHVPRHKSYTKNVDRRTLNSARPLVEEAHREAMRGEYWLSLTLNGLAYSNAFGYTASPAVMALANGAIAAGLTGKGPATAAIVPAARVKKVLTAWNSLDGRLVEASFNFRKARILKVSS